MTDFGVDELVEFRNATKCPWLLSNVIDNMTGRQLANGEVKRIIEWGGRKVGSALLLLVKSCNRTAKKEDSKPCVTSVTIVLFCALNNKVVNED